MVGIVVEAPKGIQHMTRNIEILQAAAITLNVRLKEQLTEDMKTTVQDEEQVAS